MMLTRSDPRRACADGGAGLLTDQSPAAGAVAVYLRVSTDEQRERQSIANQREFAERYCALHGLVIAGVYADDGVSGAVPIAERPAGARLLGDAAGGRFCAILVYRIDRFARSTLDLLGTVRHLEQLGVGLRSMTEPFESDSSLGRFVLTLLASMAELERETIRDRLLLGRRRAAREGRWPGGPPPLGYRLESGVLTIEPEEADLVRRIFRRYLAGLGVIAVADELNAERMPTTAMRRRVAGPRGAGGRWTAGRVAEILRNRAYVGEHVFGRSYRRLAARGPVRGPAPDEVHTQHAVPAIIDRQSFEAAAARLGRPAGRPRRSRGAFVLTGRVVCGRCGRAYVGDSGRADRAYYRCTATTAYHGRDRAKCPAKGIRMAVLDLLATRAATADAERLEIDAVAVAERVERVTVETLDEPGQVAARVSIDIRWSPKPWTVTVRSLPGAAAALGVGDAVIRRLIREGAISAIFGGDWYVLDGTVPAPRCRCCDGIIRGRGPTAIYCGPCAAAPRRERARAWRPPCPR